ncbi:MAG: hypothetical protein J6K26_06040 [Lachnospiraceae bacterium]|nr:hypothetical protein [Lachnospiraceae bacterium]
MKFIDKLERKFGKYGIPNLTVYVCACYVIGYLLELFNPGIMSMLSLDMAKVFQGQIWRLVTWVLYPPSSGNLILFIIMIFFFYYPIGTSLERTWGTFRYTLYIFSGILFTVIAALIVYLVTGGFVTINGFVYALGGSMYTTYYISMSIFLAYAVSYPNMKVLLMFVIPIKMSWMAIFYGVIILYDIISYLRAGYWFMVVPIVASFLNFAIYFFGTRDMSRYNPKEIHRKQEFRRAMEPQGRVRNGSGTVTKHKCAICGRTEQDDPNLEFRFCSKCNGNYEYCQDHLFTHQHIK